MTDWAATHRIPARVILAEGMVIQGDAHLQPRVAWRDGPETPVEMLNRPDDFFVMSLSNADVVFVAKAQVAVLASSSGLAAPDPDRETAARHIPLEVMMVGGAEYRGMVVSELPPTRARALDFLNASDPFFELVTEDGHLCLNRRFIRAARPLD